MLGNSIASGHGLSESAFLGPWPSEHSAANRASSAPMSALDGWVDICRTGVWRDATGRIVNMDEARLAAIAADYADADPAPAVIGHPAIDAPAYAWAESVRKVGDRLQAKFRNIEPAFRAWVEGGQYTGRSIKVVGNRLKHIGWLGGRAPAVDGLAPTQFADGEDGETICLAAFELGAAETRYGFMAMARIARGMRERIIASDGIEAADESIPAWEIDALQRAAEDDAAAFAATGTKEGADMDLEKLRRALGLPAAATEEQILAAAESARGAATTLAAREASLTAREAEMAQTARLAAANASLDAHVTAGRILPAERPQIAALLASLPEGDEAAIVFAGPEGAGEVRERPGAILERLFASLPSRVDFAERAGGPVPGTPSAHEDDAAIAAEARALMSDAADRGEILTAVEAVDRARRKRGLGG